MTSPIIRIPGVRMRRLTIAEYLFSSGVQGAIYRPRDLSTLFLDYPPTAPVTAMEQQVATMLDISGNGNHAFQATAGKRPVVSRRVNLLTKTEQFNDAAWGNNLYANWELAAVTPNAGLAPDGTLTADDLLFSKGINNRLHRVTNVIPGATYLLSMYVMAARAGNDYMVGGLVLRAAGGIAGSLDVGAINFATARIDPLLSETEYVRVSLQFTMPVGGFTEVAVGISGSGSGLLDAKVRTWGASLTLATDAHLTYQRVNTATDYDDNAFKSPTYLKSDGAATSYSSATGGGGNAGFFFSKAITVLGGAGTARTLFSDAGTNTGYIVRLNASNQLELAAGNGTAYTTIATAGTMAVGTTDVVQAWDDGTNLNVKIGTGPTASIARPAVAAGTAGYTMDQDNGASTGYFNGRAPSCTVYTRNMAPPQVQREAVAADQRAEARMA